MGRRRNTKSGGSGGSSKRNNKSSPHHKISNANNNNTNTSLGDDDDTFALDLLDMDIGSPLEYDIGTRVQLNLKGNKYTGTVAAQWVGKSAFVLVLMLLCVQYKDSAIWLLHLAFFSLYLTAFTHHTLT